MSRPVLEIRGLTVGYGAGPVVVDRVDLVVRAGESVALIGESGSGKTTILKAVLGMLDDGARISGEIRIDGVNVGGAGERQFRELRGEVLGYVSQDPFGAMDPVMRVGTNIAQSWRIKRRTPPGGAIAERLAGVGIRAAAERMADRPFEWSGGMLQRGSVVSARALEPRLILADEPTSALDRANGLQVMTELTRPDAALVIVSHDVDLVRGFVHRVYRIVDGRLSQDEPDPTLPAAAARAPAVVPGARAIVSGNGGTPVVAARGLARRYPSGGGLRPVDLAVHEGQILGLHGASGAGKSTLLRLLAGMEEPTAGTLLWGGAPGRPPAGQVGVVFQNAVGSLNPRWPIYRSITEPLSPTLRRRLPRARAVELATGALRRVGLADIEATRLPGSLSGGQAQRVAIARALIGDVRLLLADEPTAALDSASAQHVLDLLRTLADDGLPVVMVSHDEARLRRYADEVVELEAAGTGR